MRVAPGAWRYAGVCGVAGLLLVPVSTPLALAALALGGFVLWFHRDPDRTPTDPGVLAPADGRVSVIRTETHEREGGEPVERVRVGVFMNLTDVHVNRAPVDGTVEAVTHRPGAHRPAFSKDSERNERVTLDLDDYEVALIAGAFARRVHPSVAAGDEVARGDRIGHVSFGSRADVLLPAAYELEDVLVEVGDHVTAGETVVARA